MNDANLPADVLARSEKMLRDQRAQLLSMLTELKDRCQGVTGQREQELHEVQAVNDKLKLEVQALAEKHKQEIAQLTQRAVQAEAQLTDWSHTLNEGKKRSELAEQRITELTRKCEGLETRLTEAQRRADQVENRSSEAQKRTELAESRVVETARRCESLEARLAELLRRNESYEHQIAEATRRYQQAEQRAAEAVHRGESYEAKLAEALRRAELADKKMHELERSQHETIGHYDSVLREQSAEMDRMMQQLRELSELPASAIAPPELHELMQLSPGTFGLATDETKLQALLAEREQELQQNRAKLEASAKQCQLLRSETESLRAELDRRELLYQKLATQSAPRTGTDERSLASAELQLTEFQKQLVKERSELRAELERLQHRYAELSETHRKLSQQPPKSDDKEADRPKKKSGFRRVRGWEPDQADGNISG